MFKMYRALTLAGVFAAFMAASLTPAFAGSEGRRNTALALTAATAYTALKQNDRTAFALGLGASRAWSSYEQCRWREDGYRPQQGVRVYYSTTPRYRTYNQRVIRPSGLQTRYYTYSNNHCCCQSRVVRDCCRPAASRSCCTTRR